MFANLRITGRHVLGGFLAFFGLIFAANAVFVYFALSSWTGLETEKHYQEGLAYNRILAADDSQTALGWRARVEVENAAHGRVRIILHLQDKAGDPLDGAVVHSDLIRPTHEGYDLSAQLKPLGGGRYGAEFTLPLAGQWDVRVAAHADDRRYLLQDRVVIQ